MPDDLPVVDSPVADAPVAPEVTAPTVPEGYYPREYVEGLRGENQKYRERFEPVANTFQSLDEEMRDSWLQLIQMSQNDDGDFRAELAKQLGFNLPQEEAPQYLTATDVQRMLADERSQQQQAQALDEVYRKAEGLGYQRDTEDMVRFLWHLNQGDTPDYEAAHKAIQGSRQSVIDAYIKEKADQAQVPRQPNSPTGQPAKESVEPKTFADARAAATARFASERGQ